MRGSNSDRIPRIAANEKRVICLQLSRKFNKILYNAIFLKARILLQDFHCEDSFKI
jgi:hypothetical protein